MFEILLTNNDASINNLNYLKQYIREELLYLDKSIQCHIKDFYDPHKSIAILSVTNIVDNKPWYKDKILHSIVKGTTKYIFEVKQQQILNTFLEREVFLSSSEKDAIHKYIEPFSESEKTQFQQQFYSAISSHFQVDPTLNIDGFCRFRIKEYYETLEDMLDRAIDQHMYQQEHQEFIELLRYFVSIQTTTTELVHVMYYDENSYQILDGDFNPIQIQLEEELENGELDNDDLLVSLLITLSPEHIIIHYHKQQNNTYLFTMIEQIFAEKLQLCNGCKYCISDLVQKT